MIIETKSKVQDILELTKAGFNNKEIAEKLSVNIPAIRYWQKKLGIKAKSSVNKLTEDQKKQVLNLYEEHKNALLVAELVGSTQYLVLSYLKEIGVDTSSKFFKGELAKLAIEQYNSGMTQEEIAEYHGCERQAVQTMFKEYNIVGRTQLEQKQITWPVNQKAFTDWTNEADLFFYGLLLADGCLTGKDSIRLTLQLCDKHVIDELKAYLETGNTISVIQPSDKYKSGKATLAVSDKVLANNLRAVGMEERKSTKEKMPAVDLSDIHVAKHFWRGYICGDGSVRSYPSNNTDRLMPTIHVCGSKEICEWFIAFCEQVLGRKLNREVKKTNDKRRTLDLYYFRISGLDAKIVGLCMFDEANPKYTIRRKSENAMSFKDYIPKINRVKNK